MIHALRRAITRLALLGGLHRRGLSALSQYGGTVTGEGSVEHKTGERAGTVTAFTLTGSTDTRNRARRA